MARCNAIVGAGARDGAMSAFVDPRRCGNDGVVHYPTGPVCRNHHNAGFVPYEQTIGSVSKTLAIAERMRAVVDVEAR